MDNETKQLLEEVRDQQKRLTLLLKKRQPDHHKKDLWDRFGAIAPLLSGLLIAGAGVYCSNTFNQQQLKLQEIQTIEKFIPHLLGTEKSKQAAIMAMSSLTNTKVAAKMASLFASEGTVSALRNIAATGDTQDRTIANKAMTAALSNMGERYQEEERYADAEVAYKKALDIADKTGDSDSPDVSYSLDRLAELYKMHGRYKDAEPLLKRSLAIRIKSYGAKNLLVADALKNLSELYALEGKTKEAQALLKQVVAIDSEGDVAGSDAAEAVKAKAEKKAEAVEAASVEAKDVEPKAIIAPDAPSADLQPAKPAQLPATSYKPQTQILHQSKPREAQVASEKPVLEPSAQAKSIATTTSHSAE